MSAFSEKLREAGLGHIDRGDHIEVVIGYPHPLWDEMCDVIEAAAKVRWGYRRHNPLYGPMYRLEKALNSLEASFQESRPE